MPEPTLATEIERLHGLFEESADEALSRRWMNRFSLYAGLCHHLRMYWRQGQEEIKQEWQIDVNNVETARPDEWLTETETTL